MYVLKCFLFVQFVLFVGATENVIKLSQKRLNQLTNNTFAILHVEELTELWLENCDIRNVHKNTFNGMTSLKKLRLLDNQISRLDTDTFMDNRLLEMLDLSNNKLTVLADGLLDNTQHLHYLDLSYNNIQVIQKGVFHNLIKLTTLYLHNNRITMLHDSLFKNNFKLEQFRLDNNLISDLNFMHKNLKSLEMLSLEANRISQLKMDLLFDYPYLEKIFLRNNIINEISPELFARNLKLKHIELGENLLTDVKNGVFSHLMRLEVLSLFSNKISRIEDNVNVFPNTTTLRQLNLNDNELVYLNASIIKPLDGLRRQGIGLALNPWICDCDLQELFKEWKTIGSPFILEPTCDEPFALQGKKWADLNVEDFNCGEIESDTEVTGNKENITNISKEEFIETLA